MVDSIPPGALILVFDDDARTARMLARMLREDGFNVEVATDGASAISRLSRLPIPDAIVTDLRMPYADGVSVARYARSSNAQMPIFLITGYPELATTSHPFDPPLHLFIKPIDYEKLKEQIRRSIDVPTSTRK